MITRTRRADQPDTWRTELRRAYTDPRKLLFDLGLTGDRVEPSTDDAGFPFRVPRPFVRRMRRGDPVRPVAAPGPAARGGIGTARRFRDGSRRRPREPSHIEPAAEVRRARARAHGRRVRRELPLLLSASLSVRGRRRRCGARRRAGFDPRGPVPVGGHPEWRRSPDAERRKPSRTSWTPSPQYRTFEGCASIRGCRS